MSVYDVLYDAVQTGVTPGAAAVVFGGNDGPRLLVTTGRLGWGEEHSPVAPHTPYDLASLTKVLATTLIAAGAVSSGKLDLDETPWPAWPGVTVRHALRHDGGLAAWAPLFEEAIAHRVVGLPAGRDHVARAALQTPPETPPGEAIRYSDLGFIALGQLLEDRLGDRLDRLFLTFAASSYGTSSLRYIPLFEEGYAQPFAVVAPTERCGWRGRVMQGQVHDDNCFSMGGIAGHAGLFGSVLEVEAAARYLLEAVSGRDARPLARTLATWAQGDHARGLGWDRASEDGTTGGALSDRAVGHLGFTGTSLWVDPTFGPDGAGFVLLTNRVHPSRDREGIADVRRAFHRAAATWLRDELP